MKIGFVGLGKMGSGMARNLLKAGHEVAVYNRTIERAEPLRHDGARVAVTPADLLPADFVVSMLADDAAVEHVMMGEDGLIAMTPKGTTHISMSTISVDLSRRLDAAHKAKNQAYVAAPVFGRPDAAAAGKLFVVAAGPKALVEKCMPLFGAMGQKTFVLGSEPPAANVVKLSGNFLIASVIESLGEAFALVRKSGIDPKDYLEMLTGSLFSAPVYQNYGGMISESRYVPAGFAIPLGLKDMRLVLAAADAASVPMPVASVLRDHAISAIARGYQDHDWSVLAKVAAEDAGLES